MYRSNAILIFTAIMSITGCSIYSQPQKDPNGCVIKIDTPEGASPGKIEQATGNSPECKAIEKSIDKAI